MLYAITGQDTPGSLEKRLSVRPAHVARLQALQDEGRLILAAGGQWSGGLVRSAALADGACGSFPRRSYSIPECDRRCGMGGGPGGSSALAGL